MSRLAHADTLNAMSTTVTVISVGIPINHHQRAMNHIANEIELWQRLFSRFRPDSTLSVLNRSAGRWIAVDEIFLGLVEAARDAVIATEGRFNPAILGALEAFGYDRTIADVQTSGQSVIPVPVIVGTDNDWMLVDIDLANARVRLPRDLRIDLGGIAKGALADRLAEQFCHWPGGAISIGGDLRVWGDPPDGETWRIGIEHPLNPGRDITTVTIPGHGGRSLATSSRTKRAWQTSESRAHHLIDAFTGAPVDSSLLAVTVCARTATTAEIIAKNLMVGSAHSDLSPGMLLDADWALTVSEDLDLCHIAREAA